MTPPNQITTTKAGSPLGFFWTGGRPTQGSPAGAGQPWAELSNAFSVRRIWCRASIVPEPAAGNAGWAFRFNSNIISPA